MSLSRVRTVEPGEPYQPPPQFDKADLLELDVEGWFEIFTDTSLSCWKLMQAIDGISLNLPEYRCDSLTSNLVPSTATPGQKFLFHQFRRRQIISYRSFQRRLLGQCFWLLVIFLCCYQQFNIISRFRCKNLFTAIAIICQSQVGFLFLFQLPACFLLFAQALGVTAVRL